MRAEYFHPIMILIITSSEDATADYVTKELEPDSYIRINSEELPNSVKILATQSSAILETQWGRFRPEDFSGVWYRKPGSISFKFDADDADLKHAAAEFSAALEGLLYLIPEQKWINHPKRNIQAGYKLEQVIRAQSLGFMVPDTIITQDLATLQSFWETHHGKVIIKPLSSGYIERKDGNDSIIYTNKLRHVDLVAPDELARCPALFQEEIAKIRDIRITVVDDDIQAIELSASDATGQRLDIRRDNMMGVSYKSVKLPAIIEQKIRSLLNSYSLRFGAVDMLLHENEKDFIFLEINPNGQWAWLDMVGASTSRTALIKALQGH